jgi:hypothetical protein
LPRMIFKERRRRRSEKNLGAKVLCAEKTLCEE